MQINPQAFEQYTIAFYNLENLFDYQRDPQILDREFTPNSRRMWNKERYSNKVNKLADAISKIGYKETGKLPDIIGVAEVENDAVLNDLLNHDKLKGQPYDFIHYDSPDERGIDVALIYNTKTFQPKEHEPVTIHLYDEEVRDTTRDILYVRGKLGGQELNLYVNHWPSRRKGETETNLKRIEAARQLVEHISARDPDNLRTNHLPEHERVYTICMGDYNDNPTDESVAKELTPHGFYNHFSSLRNRHRGSVNHNHTWYLFDQIITSKSLDNDVPGELYHHEAQIYDDIMLRQWKGRYRGQPARTYVGQRYKGGYSDHFPVYSILRRN